MHQAWKVKDLPLQSMAMQEKESSGPMEVTKWVKHR